MISSAACEGITSVEAWMRGLAQSLRLWRGRGCRPRRRTFQSLLGLIAAIDPAQHRSVGRIDPTTYPCSRHRRGRHRCAGHAQRSRDRHANRRAIRRANRRGGAGGCKRDSAECRGREAKARMILRNMMSSPWLELLLHSEVVACLVRCGRLSWQKVQCHRP